MTNDDRYISQEEKAIIQKLKSEMFNALTVEHMKFYKKEIDKIYDQAERREAFLEKMEKREHENPIREFFM
ncbi:hypothetical protein LRR81_14470 [Metabacillus sp. GX 13764]|uniref:hypothetical protein n=1 Tax=Metabacillus kandeliae TaxID=2900151 RepID=UPI001E5093C8|nr:hypothetical protein [Metabacillus kandeliae]MCD7035447.1 hypothetical protein [Metabacillus kandeliae]